MTNLQKITVNLWFDSQAEAARDFYVSVFPDGKAGRTAYYGKAGFEIHGQKEGTVMTAEFSINGQDFVALNGGPHFKFNEAISLIVNCETQEEVDYFWNKLGEGGEPKAQMCGWLKDKYGLSWQIVPVQLAELMTSGDTEKSGRVMQAMLQMKKLDIKALEEA
ncbi:MAG: VOC family protein [Bacteroidota bacterium]